MGVAKHRKRKLTYQQKNFYWYICEDEDFYDILVLHIISEDKKFIVSYPIYQIKQNKIRHFMIVKGQYFKGKCLNGHWNRYYTPAWNDIIITPSFVREVLEWCFSPTEAEKTYFGEEGVWL